MLANAGGAGPGAAYHRRSRRPQAGARVAGRAYCDHRSDREFDRACAVRSLRRTRCIRRRLRRARIGCGGRTPAVPGGVAASRPGERGAFSPSTAAAHTGRDQRRPSLRSRLPNAGGMAPARATLPRSGGNGRPDDRTAGCRKTRATLRQVFRVQSYRPGVWFPTSVCTKRHGIDDSRKCRTRRSGRPYRRGGPAAVASTAPTCSSTRHRELAADHRRGPCEEPMFLFLFVAACLYLFIGDIGEGLFLVSARPSPSASSSSESRSEKRRRRCGNSPSLSRASLRWHPAQGSGPRPRCGGTSSSSAKSGCRQMAMLTTGDMLTVDGRRCRAGSVPVTKQPASTLPCCGRDAGR